MADYIKKDDIIKWIDDSVAQCGNRYSTDMMNMMDMFKTVVDNCFPFANVVPAELYQRALNDVVTLSVERKRGKMLTNEFGYESCSVCHYGLILFITDENNTLRKPNYCPNCGVKLDGDSDV